ncbi:MAG: hypothetical protein ROO76_11680 [Terriglobia bacterium]|nr:hypothetical protein [Terriglobia bacterium]
MAEIRSDENSKRKPATPHHLSLQETRKLEVDAGIVWKTGIASVVVIAANVIGSYALTRGLRNVGVIESWSPVPYIRAFANPWVLAGVIFMVGWLVSRLALLSWADLSYVLPVTALSYVLSAITGAVYLKEKVTYLHWVGISLIALGVALVALTPPETLKENEKE